MHKYSRFKRKEIVSQLAAIQYDNAQKSGSTGKYVNKLREKPYALIYKEKLEALKENGKSR